MSAFRKYQLRTGLALAIVFPAVFLFDNTRQSIVNAILFFLTFFSFILILWLFNAAKIDFRLLLRPAKGIQQRKTYLHIAFSLILSVPLYFALGYLFRQEEVLFTSILNDPASGQVWFYTVLRILLFDIGLLIARFIIDNNAEKQLIKLENEALKIEQIKATHETFKQQVDPHFLFNSLNTLQSLVKQQDTALSLQFIKELSQVYRYMLIRRKSDYVTLGEEVDYLKSYLYLLKIRFGDAFHARFSIHPKHHSTKIPVHTLQLLAENAVKHNRVTKQEPLILEIRSAKENIIVSNTILPKLQAAESSGIGLMNINKRYGLLFGKEIHIVSEDGLFKVLLPIID